jgi:hypothetical protein
VFQELCSTFGRFGIESEVVEAVFEDSNHDR